MSELILHEFHRNLGAGFTEIDRTQAVAHYGAPLTEYRALTQNVGLLDFSFRDRLCLTGADRIRFLHGQVTNDVKALRPGTGAYAAVVNAKGRMEADVGIYCLEDELLLDLEPGTAGLLAKRLEKYVVSDDVQVVEVGSLYGLLSVQGPTAGAAVRRLQLFDELPPEPWCFLKKIDPDLGEIYLANQPRLGTHGFDFYVPSGSLRVLADSLVAAVRAEGGQACGWEAFETARIEAGIPRFGADIDGSNFPQECGLESRAMSYTKGCYIGQEVLNRIHTVGHVNRVLRGLQVTAAGAPAPSARDKAFKGGQEVGYLTSVTWSPKLERTIALGYLRRDVQEAETELAVRTSSGEVQAKVVRLPV